MRRITRNLLVALLAVVVALLALGALPGLIASGDPFVVTATPVTDAGNVTNGSAPNATAVNGTALPGRRFPYTIAALEDATPNATGRSDPYWRGPIGLKEAFTHSPFDELDALQQQNPDALAGDEEVYVDRNGTRYRVGVVQEAGS